MRRGNRQKLISGDEQEWCHRWARRAYRLTRKPGIGKYNKRNMARRRRRGWRRDTVADAEDGERPRGYPRPKYTRGSMYPLPV